MTRIGWIAIWLMATGPLVSAEDDESTLEVEPDPGPEQDAEKKAKNKSDPWVPARQSGAEVGTATMRSADGLFRIDLPADWRLVENKGETTDAVWFNLYLPGLKAECSLYLRDCHVEFNPRGGPAWGLTVFSAPPTMSMWISSPTNLIPRKRSHTASSERRTAPRSDYRPGQEPCTSTGCTRVPSWDRFPFPTTR